MSRCLIALSLAATQLIAAPAQAESSGPTSDRAEMVERAIGFLKTSRDDQGAYSPHVGPAVTALVATGLIRNGRSVSDPMVADALQYVASFAQPDGGVYAPGSMYRNYETCVAIQCFQAAAVSPGASEDYAELLAAAESFVKGLQWDDEEGHDASSPSFGGAGYGRHGRPDLSNTSFLIDALHAMGRGPDDPAMQRALAFVSRTQNLESEHNTTPFATKVNDGGFYYTPAAGGSSQAGETATGGLRSYGSMTYAGLKSMIYAGVGPEDQRVKAAVAWIGRHYTVDENPGMGTSGQFYYYHTLAKALHAAGLAEVTDSEGASHDWRSDLQTKLASLQQDSGAWVNPDERWLESDPNLATAYLLLALSYCQ